MENYSECLWAGESLLAFPGANHQFTDKLGGCKKKLNGHRQVRLHSALDARGQDSYVYAKVNGLTRG